MFIKSYIIAFFLLFLGYPSSEKSNYVKNYHDNGKIKSEGWVDSSNKKVAYWKFYHPNGAKAEQGHYKDGKREKYWHFYHPNKKPSKAGHYKQDKMVAWWLFYNKNGVLNHKCQLSGGVKNGYCLKYMDKKLVSAQKFTNGKKIKEWYSLRSFKRENNLSDLR